MQRKFTVAMYTKKNILCLNTAGVMPSKCQEVLAVQFVKKNTQILAKISPVAFWEAALFIQVW